MIYSAGSIVLGWLLADILSGIIHYLIDQHLNYSPGKRHHEDPRAFIEHRFWYRNSLTIWSSIAVGICLASAFGPNLLILTATIGGAVSAQVHYYAHAPERAPGFVRRLQETGIIQSPKEHQRHHAPPQDCHFCVLTDWINPWMRRG